MIKAGQVFSNFNLGLSFYSMSKTGNFCSFFKTFFLDCIE